MRERYRTYVQLFVTILVSTGLILTFYTTYLAASKNPEPNYAFAFTNFFSYFTIQSNILVAIISMLVLLKTDTKSKTFQLWEFGSVVNITITGIIYFLFLRKVWDPQGLEYDSNAIIHYFVPIIYVLNWFFFRTKNKWNYVYSIIWLIYPLVYFVYTLVRGPLTNFYPYPFIDVSKLGYGQVLINAAGMTIFFIVTGLVIIFINKKLKR